MKALWSEVAADETDGPCPGGCGKLHRRCCDSVIGEPHQSRCPLMGPLLDPTTPDRPRWARALTRLVAFLAGRG